MQIISEKSYYIDRLLGEPNITSAKLKKSVFNFVAKYDGIYLIHNTFTKATVILESNEYISYDKIKCKGELLDFLVKYRFLIPLENDELQTFKQVYDIVEMLENSKYINSFNIFTTTDCNARCFYCFEAGIKKQYMSEQTALDVVDYISKVSNGKKVYIRWFGGEPLYNSKVIDIVSEGLNRNGINFSSHITTNAYLFNKDLITKATTLWNLTYAQITIDGTEENYNRIKNYIYDSDSSAYKIVLNNIYKLLISGIGVNVQINLFEGNFEDSYLLIDELIENFSQFEKFKIVPSYVDDSNWKKKFTSEERIAQYDRYLKIKKFVSEKDLLFTHGLNYRINGNKCLANSKHATIILPNGDLARCDVHYEKSVYGSIYKKDINSDIVNFYNVKHDLGKWCMDCAYLPNCTFLKNCPSTSGEPCSLRRREDCYQILEYALIESYKNNKGNR